MGTFSGKNTQKQSRDRADAKKRQEYYKKSKLLRSYHKVLKNEGGACEAHQCAKGQKRLRALGASGDGAADASDKAAASSHDGDGDEMPSSGSLRKKKKKFKSDPFVKEKAVAREARDKKQAEFDRIERAEKERAMKLKARKDMSKKMKQRDSRGRPRVRNTITNILQKLQK